MITCSIHATEVASTHTAVEFAYRLLTEDNNPKFKAILDNVIILLEPSAKSRRRRHRDPVVSQDARHAVRRHLAAAGLQPLRRPRQQSRLVHLLAAGNARHGGPREYLASADRLRRPPDGPIRRAHVRPAVARSGGSEYRSAPRQPFQHDRRRHGHRSRGRGQNRRGHQRHVRLLVARQAVSGLSRRARGYSPNRPARSLPHRSLSRPTRFSRPHSATIRANEAGTISRRG